MKQKLITFLFTMFVLAMVLTLCAPKQKSLSGPYTADWESLSQNNVNVDWFLDAKFGIYFHWGVYTVPAFGNEWYPRNMHFKGRREYNYHVKNYGHPSEFGYHDFVPMFKAEHFDAEEWADLFQKAGARFAGPVAEHHDGFSMWASDITPWNAGDKGPKRDITGELAQAFRKRNMKLITTFHHARNLQRHDSNPADDHKYDYRNSHYPFYEGMPPTSDDPELKMLYGNIPEQEWIENVWYAKLVEVIDKYQPDIIYFDSWLNKIPEIWRQKFCAYYLNRAHEWGKEVVITFKQQDLPQDVGVLDLEKSRMNELTDYPWMTDDTISKGSWCYTRDLKIKSTSKVLHSLIDITSKNGVLVLNISPKSDGTIPPEQKNVLLELGEWLNKYGEAIYETRPWITFGEGPTKLERHRFGGYADIEGYSAQDIRYTQKGNAVYAITLGAPDQVVLLTAPLRVRDTMKIKSVSIAGSDLNIKWQWTQKGLLLNTRDHSFDDLAVVFKIIIE